VSPSRRRPRRRWSSEIVHMADNFYYSVFQTNAGWVGLQYSTSGLRRVILPRKSAREVQELISGDALETPDAGADLQERLQAYFSGRRVDFADKPDFSGATPFQRQVWQATRLIPYGETRSYQWVASHIGKPRAARAVGQALGKNPLPIIVPCHRVVASGGGPGGFTGGIEMKRRLLKLEADPTKSITGLRAAWQ
jgi:methylated-DNA-[protein]-cysteine S-methyltransferase